MRKLLVSSVGLLAVSSVASAAVVARYEFGQGAPQVLDVNLLGSAPSPSALNVLNVNATSTSYFSGTNPFLQVAPSVSGQTDPATAYSNGNYFALTLTPVSGFYLDLDSLSFDVFRGGASGIRGYTLYSSVDGFSAALSASPGNNETGTRSAPRAESITLSPSFDNLTTSTTFRFYIHSLNNSSSVEFDNITFEGQVLPIPEPAGLSALAVAGLLLRRRRD
jgi:hypothetical protein